MSNVMNMFSLKGRTALVTGCKRGIGRGMAQALAQAGANIIGVSASLESEGSDIEKDVLACGREFTGYACDTAARHQCLFWRSQIFYSRNAFGQT